MSDAAALPIDTHRLGLRLADVLARATHLLSRAEDGADAARADGLMGSRLAPDMLSLAQQIVVLADSLEGAAALLTGREADEMPSAAWVFNRGSDHLVGPMPQTLGQARDRLDEARRSVLASIDMPRLPARQDAARPLVVARPGHARHFALHRFVDDYLLPNAYFHLTMIHALLRHAGVPIGKADYEGPRPYTLG